MKVKLNKYQRKFVAIYSGNATQAAKKAGYSKKTAYSQGQRLLKNVEIAKALAEREKKELSPLVADRQERQKFWTDVLRSQVDRIRKVKMDHRLKASELLGKSEADFTDKVLHTGLENLAEQIKAARKRREQGSCPSKTKE